jgi:hypothetical protein
MEERLVIGGHALAEKEKEAAKKNRELKLKLQKEQKK